MNRSLYRRRLSLFAFMLIFGFGMASWVVRTPAVRDAVDASTATMGLILFGLSVGSMVGVISSGPLVKRLGARPVILAGAILGILGVSVVGLSSMLMSAPGVFVGLLLFGMAGGLGEIGLNIEGADVEAVLGAPVLPMLHGSFSLGTVVGALVGIGLTAIDFPVVWHLLGVAVGMTLIAAWAFRGIPAGTGKAASGAGTRAPKQLRPRSVWRDPRLVVIGIVVLAMAFAEGAANDWLPLLMVDGHGMSATLGSLVYAGFAAMMTVGRFLGGPVVERFGRTTVLQVSAIIAIVGILTVVYSPNAIVAGIAVILWGLGASLGFPVAISAAGDSPDRAAERVSAVATSGYLAFLVGPPLLGFLGEHLGLRPAMLAVIAILLVAVCAARFSATRPPVTTDADADSDSDAALRTQ
jgi:fucose permease